MSFRLDRVVRFLITEVYWMKLSEGGARLVVTISTPDIRPRSIRDCPTEQVLWPVVFSPIGPELNQGRRQPHSGLTPPILATLRRINTETAVATARMFLDIGIWTRIFRSTSK